MKHNLRRAVATESSGEIDGKERRPAHDETTHNNADSLGRFLLLVETAQL